MRPRKPGAPASTITSARKGRDNRARGYAVGASFAGENVNGQTGEIKPLLFAGCASNLGSVAEQNKANGGIHAAGFGQKMALKNKNSNLVKRSVSSLRHDVAGCQGGLRWLQG